MRLSLVFATLQYRLLVTAQDDAPPVLVAGDMIGAHATLSRDEQLAPAADALPVLHRIPALAAGAALTLTGQLQVPLAAIRPLRQGEATFFVPLVRLCLLPEPPSPPARRVFTLGSVSGSDTLAPLRLDTGPREVRDLGAREIAAAQALPVLPERRAAS